MARRQPGAHFSRASISELLGLAAELQAIDSERSDTLSYAELESIAGEVGIQPEYVRKAVDLTSSGTNARRHKITGPVSLTTRTITLDKSTSAEAVEELFVQASSAAGLIDTSEYDPQRELWVWRGGERVRVLVSRGKSALWIQASLDLEMDKARRLWFSAIGGAVAGVNVGGWIGAAIEFPPGALVGTLAGIALGLVVGRRLWSRHASQWSARLDALLQAVRSENVPGPARLKQDIRRLFHTAYSRLAALRLLRSLALRSLRTIRQWSAGNGVNDSLEMLRPDCRRIGIC